MTINDPKLVLEFLGNDLEVGHSTTQTLTDTDIVRQAITFKQQRFNGLKSSSDTVTMKLRRKCSAVEDIIATEGDIKAVLKDGDTPLFTGFISTNFSWGVTDHGDQALNITLESMGTRLFNKDFIETGKYFFDCPAATAIYNIVHPLGITIHSGDERKLLQTVQKSVEGGTTCRQLIDQLFYECNAVYWFNALGELCVETITADTTGAPTYDSAKLRMKDRKVVNLSKKIRTYKGARIAYDELSSANNYLIYRNTTNATATRICNLELPAGCYFDGAEIYTAAEWSAAMADTYREPTLISAVNAASESSIVGSGEIVNIKNLVPNVLKDAEITFSAEAVGGAYFKILAHNTAITTKTIWRMDLSADISFVKSHGVIRALIEGATDGKSMLEEELSWIHDRDNATKHANLLAQYHKYASSSYTFYSNDAITLGSVVKLNDNVYSGLEVYVLVTARQFNDTDDTYIYTAVGVTTFDLTESAYHGTTEEAKQSGAQGPSGEPGASAEVQYAIGSSYIDPPGDSMQWGGADMLWSSATMFWNTGTWENDVPDEERGRYIWMRVRIGDSPWQYTRLTGTTAWDAENLGVCTTATPTQTSEGLNLQAGDYFVAGAQFTEDRTPYNAGYAYVYKGSGWDEMDLSEEENATKALALLSKLSSAGIDIPASTSPYSVWQWAENFVAKNAIIQNIASQNIRILNDGCIYSDYYNADGSFDLKAKASTDSQDSPIDYFDEDTWFARVGNIPGSFSWGVTDVHAWGFDCQPISPNTLSASNDADLANYGIYLSDGRHAEVGDRYTVLASSATGASSGFWLGADGTFKCHSAQADSIRITGDSVFNGMFNCDVIKTVAKSTTTTNFPSSTNSYQQALKLYGDLEASGFVGDYIPATIVGVTSPVKYLFADYWTVTHGATTEYHSIQFFDENFNEVDISNYVSITKSSGVGGSVLLTAKKNNVYSGAYATSGITIGIYADGKVLELNIPSAADASSLTTGQLFKGAATTVSGITCYPIYMKA